MTDAGMNTGASESAVVPLIVGSDENALGATRRPAARPA